MNPNLIAQLEKMTAEEQQELLDTQFPAELEKEAAAEVAQAELTNALYTYGWLAGERALAEAEGNGDLSKVASAEDIESHEQSEADVSALIDESVEALALGETADEIEMHKIAQVCAAVIFDGYSDAIEKVATAVAPVKGKKFLESLKSVADAAKKKLHSGVESVKGGAESVKKHVKEHGKKYSAGAGLGAGLAAGHLMSKKASDMTVGEFFEVTQGVHEVNMGVEKLASKGVEKGKSLMQHFRAAKHIAKSQLKQHGKHMAGAGGLGLAGGIAAGHAIKE